MKIAFSPLEKTLQDLHILPVNGDQDNGSVMRQLLHFDYRLAGCYDPSKFFSACTLRWASTEPTESPADDQMRLSHAIEAIGGNTFNIRIRDIASHYLGTEGAGAPGEALNILSNNPFGERRAERS